MLLTAESVSTAHPDSSMDYIVNSILDEYLKQDPLARVAIDGVVKNKYITLGGEITSTATVDIEAVIRRAITEIGYTFEPIIDLHIYEQSPEIALGTNEEVAGAGDQGTITGYAVNDNSSMIPTEKALADEILRELYQNVRPNNPLIKPDMKSQVTIKPIAQNTYVIDTVVLAIQHAEEATEEQLRTIAMTACEKVFDEFNISEDFYKDMNLIINGTGKFVIGGPEADSGEVGRKVVVDAYGVSVPVGGGTFNGKDPTKVDRSAAYYARYVAKNVVASGVADECLITVSYCIGLSKPISIRYDFKGKNHYPQEVIEDVLNSMFSFEPKDIITELDLRRPIYAQAGVISHFGHVGKTSLSTGEEITVPWEQIDKAGTILELVEKAMPTENS